MTKTNLLVLMFLTFAYASFGQYIPLLNDSAQWKQGMKTCYLNGFTIECQPWGYLDFQLNGGDTIIGNYTYKKVIGTDHNNYAYLREDSGKVYVKYEAEIYTPYYLSSLYTPVYILDTTEIVLYDFNLQVGDTFTTRVFTCNLYLAEGDTINYNQDFLLTSIDTVLLNNGNPRKRYRFNNIFYGDYSQYYFGTVEWIEGIGSTSTFFYNEASYYTSCGNEGYDTKLSIACYSTNNNILWGVENCLFPTITNENIHNNNTSIYPNPINNLLSIKSSDVYTNYTIYNSIGTLIQKGLITNNSVDFSILPNGTYIITLYTNNNNLYRALVTK